MVARNLDHTICDIDLVIIIDNECISALFKRMTQYPDIHPSPKLLRDDRRVVVFGRNNPVEYFVVGLNNTMGCTFNSKFSRNVGQCFQNAQIVDELGLANTDLIIMTPHIIMLDYLVDHGTISANPHRDPRNQYFLGRSILLEQISRGAPVIFMGSYDMELSVKPNNIAGGCKDDFRVANIGLGLHDQGILTIDTALPWEGLHNKEFVHHLFGDTKDLLSYYNNHSLSIANLKADNIALLPDLLLLMSKNATYAQECASKEDQYVDLYCEYYGGDVLAVSTRMLAKIKGTISSIEIRTPRTVEKRKLVSIERGNGTVKARIFTGWNLLDREIDLLWSHVANNVMYIGDDLSFARSLNNVKSAVPFFHFPLYKAEFALNLLGLSEKFDALSELIKTCMPCTYSPVRRVFVDYGDKLREQFALDTIEYILNHSVYDKIKYISVHRKDYLLFDSCISGQMVLQKFFLDVYRKDYSHIWEEKRTFNPVFVDFFLANILI
jgi:hypothetical protein